MLESEPRGQWKWQQIESKAFDSQFDSPRHCQIERANSGHGMGLFEGRHTSKALSNAHPGPTRLDRSPGFIPDGVLRSGQM
jgi:hypothetical protein